MPKIDLSMLNQRQTPAFYADVLANRPAAGFIGRIFVSTNTYAFYRDNGTGWDLIGGPGTGTVTGSGTAGQVTYWDGASSITGSNNLFWDSAAGHLGINTNTPGTGLDVHDTTSTILQLNTTTATNDTRIAFQNAGTSLWRIGNFYNAGANDWGIYDVVGAAQPLTIKKTTGQVLIGTSTVGAGKLVVSSASADNGVQVVGASAPSVRIDNAVTGATKRAGLGISTATNNFIQGSADRDFCIFNGSTAAASPILFGVYDAGAVNVQEAARISAARNFLIGTTTDTGEKLQISGTSYFNGTGRFNGQLSIGGNFGIQTTSPTTSLQIGSGSGLQQIYLTGGGYDLVFGTSGGGLFGFASQTISGIFNTSSTPIGIGSNGAQPLILGTSNAERARFTPGGNLLIGTTTDAGYKLAVNGTINAAGTIYSAPTGNANGLLVVNGTTGSYGGNVAFQRGGTQDGVIGTQATNNTIITGATNADICILADGGGRAIRLSTTSANVQFTVKSTGVINIANVPTSAAGLVSGDIYRTANVLNIVP